MNVSTTELPEAKNFNGLTALTPGLPASSYFDPPQYEADLTRIWYRNWIYAGRTSAWDRARAFQTLEIGTQRVLILRDDEGDLRAFHNTCRHRGSALCTARSGHLVTGQLVCPYCAGIATLSAAVG